MEHTLAQSPPVLTVQMASQKSSHLMNLMHQK
jgi:hypothetical protein